MSQILLHFVASRCLTLSRSAVLAAALLAAARAEADVVMAITTPTIEVQALTHTYSPGFLPFDPPSVIDSISIGDGNYTGGGAFSVPGISTGDVATIRIQAPARQKFVIHDSDALLGLNFYWQAGGDTTSLSGGTATFENLVGSPPPISYSFLGVGNAGNVIGAQLEFQPLGLIEFTALNIEIPVQSSPSPGVRDFGAVASSSSLAFYAYSSSPDDHVVMSIETAAVPEASAFLMLGAVSLGAMGIVAVRRRSRCMPILSTDVAD